MLAHGVMQNVDASEHPVLLGRDPSLHVYPPIEQRPLMVAREQLQVRGERPRLALREELARFHSVHQKHQLGQCEVPPHDRVLHRVPLVGADVETEFLERLKVAVDALALRRYLVGMQAIDELRHRQPVALVGLLFEDALQVQQLQLGLAVVRHDPCPFSCAPSVLHALITHSKR